jgi:hypothetical protein
LDPEHGGLGASLWQVGEKGTVNNEIEAAWRARLRRGDPNRDRSNAIEVHAPAQVVFTAVEAVSVEGVRFLRELEFIRALPSLAATGRLDVPTVDAPPVLSFTRGAVCWARGHPKKS